MITRLLSVALAASVSLVLFVAPAQAASVDLAVTDGDIGPGTSLTGDLNTSLYFLRNRSSVATDVKLTLTTDDRVTVLGVQNWGAVGTAMANLECTNSTSGAKTVTSCTTKAAAMSTTTVAAILGAVKGGTTTVMLAATPVGNTDPSPKDARDSVTGKQAGPSCTVVGKNSWVAGSGAETLTGTDGSDVLCGFGGYERCKVVQSEATTENCNAYMADQINGLAGDDQVLLPSVDVMGLGRGDAVDLGAGTDTIRNVAVTVPAVVKLGTIATLAHTFNGKTTSRHQVAGAERYVGGPMADRVTGSSANEDILGGAGNDTLRGGGGTDQLFGGAGDDVLLGDAGTDVLMGGLGADTGGPGDATAAVIDVTAHTIAADGATDTFSSVEMLRGTSGDDSFAGSTEDDYFITGGGNDTVTGGAGNDVLAFTAVGGKGVMADMQTGSATVDTTTVKFSGIERVIGTSLADRIFGSKRGDTIEGEKGDDVINGRAGFDLLIGGAGNDTILGGLGTDSLYGGPGTDVLRGDDGDDTCFQTGDTMSVPC